MKKRLHPLFILCLTLVITQVSRAQSLNPLTIGTIGPGDSIVIYYDVTINTPCNCTQISNQGTVMGSNFASFNTDDPNTATIGDPTITLLNLFPLPVHLVEVSAQRSSNGILISWLINSETDMVKYEVERSFDGRNFTKIGEVVSVNSQAAKVYSLTDQSPNNGLNYYRLRLIDQRVAPKYSSVVKVDMSGKSSGIVLYPNPVRERQMIVQLNNLEKGTYKLRVYANTGQEVYSKDIPHVGGSVNRPIVLPAALVPGLYHVRIQDEKSSFTQSMIVQ